MALGINEELIVLRRQAIFCSKFESHWGFHPIRILLCCSSYRKKIETSTKIHLDLLGTVIRPVQIEHRWSIRSFEMGNNTYVEIDTTKVSY